MVLSRRRGLLGSGVAVAVAEAGSYRSDSSPSLGTSICLRCGPKKNKKINKNKINEGCLSTILNEVDPKKNVNLNKHFRSRRYWWSSPCGSAD